MSGSESHMQPEGIDEKLLIKYFPGELSEEEQVQVEDRAFADKHCLDDLEAAEADLIDAYVRGDLPQSARRTFERRFLTSPQRERKVEVRPGSCESRGGIQSGGNSLPNSVW